MRVIRHYGLLAGSNRAETIEAVRKLLNPAPPATEETSETDPAQPLAHPCPCCGGRVFVIETFAAGCQPRHRPIAPRAAIRIELTIANTLSPAIARFPLFIDRQRYRPARQAPGTAFEAAYSLKTQRQHRSLKVGRPIRRPQSHDPRTSTAPANPPHRDQIPIARAEPSDTSTSRGFLPWRLSDDGLQRMPQRLVGAVIRNPSQGQTHQPR
jgi:hypothetical protein